VSGPKLAHVGGEEAGDLEGGEVVPVLRALSERLSKAARVSGQRV
jgi:hypothetical protein